jgi:hypothetical protein
MPSFIQFGCWNKGGCKLSENKEEFNPLTHVMYNLRKVTESRNPPEFVIVSGDNYYPEKGKPSPGQKKPKKIIDTNKLLSGLECLPHTIPVHIILGNHDLESDVSVKGIEDDERNKCFILDTEIEYARSTDHQTNVNVYKSIIFNNDTLVLMIDSTMYENKESIALKCFRHLYQNQSLSLEDIRRDQKLWVESIIRNIPKNIKNIVISAHHPITGYKSKMKIGKDGNEYKNTFLIETPGFNLVDLLYESIYKKLSIEKRNEISFYYLCADLHQYQIGNIEISPEITSISSEGEYNPTMSIKQYIVGTGGTSLDDYPFEEQKVEEGYYDEKSFQMLNSSSEGSRLENNYYDIKYKMTREQINLSGSKYGFLKCQARKNSRKLRFSFISIDGNILQEAATEYVGGRKRNTRKKHRRKLNKRKTNKRKSNRKLK